MNPSTAEPVYEGKAKKIFATDDPQQFLVYFKDDATAFNGQKHEIIPGKGRLNNFISAILLAHLAGAGIRTHFVRLVDQRHMVVQKLTMIPVEVVVRHVASGSLVKRLGLERGRPLEPPVLELYFKNDALNDPLINDDHVRILGAAHPDELPELRNMALQVAGVLQPLLRQCGIRLVDFKLEFGRDGDHLVLGDEISPDTCRFWDAETGKILDKDRFRQDLGGLVEAYEDVLTRLGGDAAAEALIREGQA